MPLWFHLGRGKHASSYSNQTNLSLSMSSAHHHRCSLGNETWNIKDFEIEKSCEGPSKRGHFVADALLLMMFPGRANARDTKWMLCFHAAQTGKHLLRTRNVSEQNQKHFLCPRTQNLCPQQMLRARANGETFVRQQCVRNNVSLFARALKEDI